MEPDLSRGVASRSGEVRDVSLLLPQPLHPVTFLRRVNRFAAVTRLAGRGQEVYVHLPNSGRMSELLVPGALGLAHLEAAAGAGQRRTRGTLLLVRHADRWVGVDARTPNRLFEAAAACGGLGPIARVTAWRREVRLGPDRLDFLVTTDRGTWLVETKSCNRVERGVALFPDAPTSRGSRHLRLLARVARRGRRAALVWFVQRADARVLRPDRAADPAFADAAAAAARARVRFLAYTCRVTPQRIAVLGRIPVGIVGET